MTDFDSHITINEFIESKDVRTCNYKELSLDSQRVKIETPLKVLSGKSVPSGTVDSLLSEKNTPIFEFTKAFVSINNYSKIVDTLENGGINKDWTDTLDIAFGIRKGVQKKFNRNLTLSSVFRLYPLNDVAVRNTRVEYQKFDKDLYQAYLDYIYGASSAFILTPDVLLSPPGTRQISINEYLNFIDFSVGSLECQNRKPIFVPVQIDLASKELNAVLGHYKHQGYTNIWINFKAKPCNGSNVGKLRTISRLVDEYLGNDAIIYCSQLKRERDVNRNSVPAFDVVPSFISADFLGINRTNPAFGVNTEETATRKGFSSVEEYYQAQMLIKQSLFNSDTYTYCLPSEFPGDMLGKVGIDKDEYTSSACDFINGVLIDDELSVIKQKIQEGEQLLPYLSKKDGISSNANILETLSYNKPTLDRPSSLEDFF